MEIWADVLCKHRALLASAFASEQDVVDQLCPKPGCTLAQYLSSFPTLLCVLQTAAALERVTFEICEDLYRCGVRYAELRYCPSLHRAKGLADDAIVAAVAAGLRRASVALAGARFYQIITALRDPVERVLSESAASTCASEGGGRQAASSSRPR